MGVFVNPDNSAFQVALNSEIYVDKSGLIQYTNKVLNTLQGYICNSRPRRFGKSYAANMLTAYYSRGCDSEAMFAGLEISKSADFQKHLNKYDVIHIDVQWFLGRNSFQRCHHAANQHELRRASIRHYRDNFGCSGQGGYGSFHE